MGQVYYKDRDGLTQGFTISGDTPTASEQERISSMLAGKPLPTQEMPQEQGIMGALGSGIGAGANQVQAGLMGIGGLLAKKGGTGQFLGYNPADYERMRGEQNAEAGEYTGPEGSLADQDGAYGASKYLAYQFGQSLPATVGGTIGAVAGSMLAPGPGTFAGFMAGAGLAGTASLPQSFNENLQTQIAQHGYVKDEGKAFGAAVVQSGLEGTADRALLGLSGALGAVIPMPVKSVVADATKGAFAQVAKKVGTNVAAGFTTEATTEAVQQAITRWQAEKPLGGPEAQKEYLENAIVGGLLGGAMGGVMGSVGAYADAKETKKYEQIRKDLDAEDKFGDVEKNIEENRLARFKEAQGELVAEEALSGPSQSLLEDLRSDKVLVGGPRTFERSPVAGAAEPAGVAKDVPAAAAPADKFSVDEYTSALTAMRGEPSFSPDKIKSKLKVGRAKADALFEAMRTREDAVATGSKGQYLKAVDNSTTGKIEAVEPTTEMPASRVERTYEVRPVQKEDVAPYRVIRQGGKQIGPEFKTPDQAHDFASQHKLDDYAVTETPQPKSFGVYEVTSGVENAKPVSRFVKGYSTDQEARDYANGLNPKLSPTTNKIVADNGRVMQIKRKQAEQFGRYQNNVQTLVDKLVGPGRTAVDLVESIEAPDGSGVSTGNIIEGSVQTINGLRRMQIASGINDPSLSPDQFQQAINSVAHHEVLHVAKEAGLFTPSEWKSLVNRANTRVRDKNYTYLERAQVRTQGAPVGATLDEEAVAEMVRDYMRNPSAFENVPRSLLRRLLDFIQTFGSYSRSVNAGNAVLGDFASGEIGKREGKVTREDMYGPFYSAVKIPGFYMKSAKFFEDLAERDGPERAYPGQQWIGMLNPSKTGVKDEELQWLGLKDWLQGQKKVSIGDILQFIGANSIDLHEKTLNQPYNESQMAAINHRISELSVQKQQADTAEEAERLLEEITELKVQRNNSRHSRPFHEGTTQKGGEDYTEMLFHMPMLEPSFNEPFHFDGFPNLIATARFKTRHLDGKKTLFIEEMQSDLHQQGRKKGYTSKDTVAKMDELSGRIAELNKAKDEVRWALDNAVNAGDSNKANMLHEREIQFSRDINGLSYQLSEIRQTAIIPDAPLRSSWHEFVVKRLVRHAAENNFDAITWNAEPEGVRQTEQYPNLKTEIGPDGEETYKVGVDADEWGDQPDLSSDVTGIVNFYTKRLPRDIKKLFSKAEFGNPQVYMIERVKPTEANIDYNELFPTADDFYMVMQQLANEAGYDPVWAKSYKKAIQIARNQRQFNAEEAIGAANLGGRWVEDFNAAFPEYAIEEQATATTDDAGNPNVARWGMDITPELKDTALSKGFPMFSSVQTRKAPTSPEFRNWFRGSHVVGDDGKPLVVYHGTVNDFDAFNENKGVPNGYLGAGFYFTDNSDDASGNYAAPDAPDLLAKMQDETDRWLAEDYDGPIDDEGVADEVRSMFMQHDGAVMPVYLAIKNPVVLDGKASTFIDPSMAMDMIRAAPVDDFLNVDAEAIASDMTNVLRKGMGAEGVQNVLRKSSGVMDAIEPETGMDAVGEVIRRMFQGAGFDGAIIKGMGNRFPMFDNIEPDTTHYIAFKPQQIKSVNNNGDFNPQDKRILFSSVQIKPSYSATGTMGTRVPAQAPATTLADVEAAITYNNIAPALQGLMGKIGVSKQKAESIAEGSIIGLQDKMQPLAKLIDRVRANKGMISNESDPYLREQLMSGVVDTAIQNHKKTLYDPIIKAVHNLSVTQQSVDELLARHPSNMATINGVQREMSAVRNILGNYKNPKMALAELYIYAQHAKERNAVMRERNQQVVGQRPQQFDSGSGMTDYEADDVLLWFGSKPFASQFMSLGNQNSIRSLYRKLINSTNDTRVMGGLNPDFRMMYDANGQPLNKYQDYAPLRGYTDDNPDHVHDELTNSFARAGKGMKIMGKEDMAATGRRDEAANLIGNAILQNEEAIVRAEKNKVGQTFLKMLNDNMGITLPTGPNTIPNTMSDFAEVVPLTKQKPTYDAKSGVVRMGNQSIKMDPDIMIVKQNGQEVGIKLKDPKLRASFLEGSTLGNTGQNALIKGLLSLNRFLAAVRTSYNPEFMLSNFLRDLGAASLNLSEYQMKGLRSAVAMDALPAIKGVYQALRDKNPSNPWRIEFEEFAARGGKTAFMGLRDLESTIERIMKELQTDPGGNMEKVMEKAKALRDLIEAGNDAVENGIRVSTYKHLKERLTQMSKNPVADAERIKNRAAYAAKNLTVNFNMGGTMKPTMQAWYLFFNASLQGSAALVNPLIRSKKVRQFWLAAIAAGALQDIIMSALSPTGDDGQKEYDKIPEQVLETNMILFNPLSERGYIKIPMPYLFNAAWNAGRAFMRTARGGYSMGEGLNSIAGTAAESLNPWGGGGSWLNFVAPTVLDPAVELVANKNFMEAPIAPPENPYGVGDIPAQKYWNNTSPAYVNVAWMLDRASGGDGVFPGRLSFSPNQYEYGFEWLLGGAWSTVLRAFDFAVPETLGGGGRGAKLLTGGEVSSNDIPFVRRFIGNITTREDLSGYIDKKDKVLTVRNALKAAIKDGDGEAYQQIIQSYPQEYKLAARINAVEAKRRKIGAQIKKVLATKKLSEEQKKKLVDPLKKQQEVLVNQANAFMSGV